MFSRKRSDWMSGLLWAEERVRGGRDPEILRLELYQPHNPHFLRSKEIGGAIDYCSNLIARRQVGDEKGEVD